MSQNTASAFAAQKNITYKTESEEFPKFKTPCIRDRTYIDNRFLVGFAHEQYILGNIAYNASCVNEIGFN